MWIARGQIQFLHPEGSPLSMITPTVQSDWNWTATSPTHTGPRGTPTLLPVPVSSFFFFFFMFAFVLFWSLSKRMIPLLSFSTCRRAGDADDGGAQNRKNFISLIFRTRFLFFFFLSLAECYVPWGEVKRSFYGVEWLHPSTLCDHSNHGHSFSCLLMTIDCTSKIAFISQYDPWGTIGAFGGQ